MRWWWPVSPNRERLSSFFSGKEVSPTYDQPVVSLGWLLGRI